MSLYIFSTALISSSWRYIRSSMKQRDIHYRFASSKPNFASSRYAFHEWKDNHFNATSIWCSTTTSPPGYSRCFTLLWDDNIASSRFLTSIVPVVTLNWPILKFWTSFNTTIPLTQGSFILLPLLMKGLSLASQYVKNVWYTRGESSPLMS